MRRDPVSEQQTHLIMTALCVDGMRHNEMKQEIERLKVENTEWRLTTRKAHKALKGEESICQALDEVEAVLKKYGELKL